MSGAEKRLLELGATSVEHSRYPSGQARVVGVMPCAKCGILLRVDGHNALRRNFTGCCKNCNGKRNILAAQNPRVKRCGSRNPKFKRGYWITREGYRELHIPRQDSRRKYCTRREGDGRIPEHRLVMSELLDRPLKRWEHVHHKNGDKLDNRAENLELLSPRVHAVVTALERENRELRILVGDLRAELDNLRLMKKEFDKLP